MKRLIAAAILFVFIISSYFFFCKMNKCDIENKKIFLKKYFCCENGLTNDIICAILKLSQK